MSWNCILLRRRSVLRRSGPRDGAAGAVEVRFVPVVSPGYVCLVSDIELLLNVAREADYWDFAVRIGEDIDPDEQSPDIEARGL